jgi:hypothetical protein
MELQHGTQNYSAQEKTIPNCILEERNWNFSQDTDQPHILRGFPQSIQQNPWIIPQIRPRPLHSALLPSNYSLINLRFGAV